MNRMAQVDSGHESLVSDECSTPPYPEVQPPPTTTPYNRPPKITPFSGVLDKGKVVVRPVACKPAMTPAARFSNAGERYGSTPILARPGSQLTLYGSNSDLRNNHGRNSNFSLDRKLLSSCASMSSSPPLAMTSLSSLPLSSSRKLNGYDSLENVSKSVISTSIQNIHNTLHGSQNLYRSKCSPFRLHSSGDGGSLLDLTPSPSDSGVAELEAALRERDAELIYLRQTMEHNEQAIVRVYQEKERVWERELRRMKSAHENRLRAGAQKALKLEQMLMMQSYQLQEEKKRIKEETNQEASELRQEITLLRGRLGETEWGLCEKTGELALIKTQLKDAQNEQTSKAHELLQLRSQQREQQALVEQQEEEIAALNREAVERTAEVTSLKEEVNRLTAESQKCREMHQAEVSRLQVEIQRLERDLAEMRAHVEEEEDRRVLEAEVRRLGHEVEEERAEFERERVTWAQEKEKVLRYQRQLQLNYVQMFRRTRSLETEVESLTLELEMETKGVRTNAAQKQLPAIEL